MRLAPRGVGVVAIVLAAGVLATVWRVQFHPPQRGIAWSTAAPVPTKQSSPWRTVGGDSGMGRYSSLAQITRENVGRLAVAWTYHTGDAALPASLLARSKFETTPIEAGGNLILCTPFDRVIALDPLTGRERWRFDPKIDLSARPANDFNCRGLSQFEDTAATETSPCRERVFIATNDRRLFALDARSGARCPSFGSNGEVRVVPDSETHDKNEVQIVSPPAVVGDVVITGSSVAENQRADASTGLVRAFDARTGARRWQFDPVPGGGARTGGGNVWSTMSADLARGLVFLPTASPSPVFYGGARQGDPSFSDAIVALHADTGRVAWSFQTVHHDLWDYDVAAAPAAFTLHRDGQEIPGLAFATKAGFVFALNRDTGAPLWPVVERPVPQSDVPGEHTSPTQPFSSLPAVAPQTFSPADAFGVAGFDGAACRRHYAGIRNEGVFTPPSLQGSLYVPTTAGGANWGGVAIDPATNRLVVNATAATEVVRLIPRAQYDADAQVRAAAAGPQTGTPYAVMRGAVLSPLGVPCNRPPWGVMTAIDLDTGTLAWRQRLGTTDKLAPLGIALPWGAPNIGGPLITGGGLVFIGAATDAKLRAFALDTGRELWAADLPAGAFASPMTYAAGGRQYVVIAAGGHAALPGPHGDAVIAFALPR